MLCRGHTDLLLLPPSQKSSAAQTDDEPAGTYELPPAGKTASRGLSPTSSFFPAEGASPGQGPFSPNGNVAGPSWVGMRVFVGPPWRVRPQVESHRTLRTVGWSDEYVNHSGQHGIVQDFDEADDTVRVCFDDGALVWYPVTALDAARGMSGALMAPPVSPNNDVSYSIASHGSQGDMESHSLHSQSLSRRSPLSRGVDPFRQSPVGRTPQGMLSPRGQLGEMESDVVSYPVNDPGEEESFDYDSDGRARANLPAIP